MSDEPMPSPEQRLMVMRIIHGALCMGVALGTAVLAGARLASNQPPAVTPLLSYVGLGFAAVAIVLSFVVPSFVLSNGIRQWVAKKGRETTDSEADDEAFLWPMYQPCLIVGMALLEGAAVFQAIAYFVEAMPLSLGVAAGMLLIMLMRLPTHSSAENWLSAGREEILRMRQDR